MYNGPQGPPGGALVGVLATCAVTMLSYNQILNSMWISGG